MYVNTTLCVTRAQPPGELAQRGAYRFEGVGVVGGRRASVLLEARPFAEHAPPLEVGLANQFLQAALGTENLSDVKSQHDQRLAEVVEQQFALRHLQKTLALV